MRLLVTGLILLLCSSPAFAQDGLKKKKPRPYEYGNVVIDNFSSKSGLMPVTFDHWSHRAKYTCRLCHVDIGFAMKAGGTEITSLDNQRGYFCGTCHNGKRPWSGRAIFTACSSQLAKDDLERCARCHTTGKNPAREEAFAAFAAGMPRERFGNGIDWETAEKVGLIKPIDFLEGASAGKAPLTPQKDFAISTKVEGMPEIIFSHKKHTVWNGCEVCHPEIFLGIKKGTTKYTMIELFEGKYCGVCHDKVAFPQTDCRRCHVKSVQ